MTGKTHISIGLAASATVLSINSPTVENVAAGLIIGFKLLLGNLALYFSIGFISHMAADTLTNSGIEVLYPIRKKAALKLIHTGSILDHALGVLAFIYFIFTMSKIF